MGVSREIVEAVGRLIAPHATRIKNMVVRGVVQLVNDGAKMQLVQLGALPGETIEGDAGVEHFQAYGFSSVPHDGAEALALFPGGDRSHAVVLAATDRRYRPTGGQRGEVCMYTDEGDVIRLGRGHIVSVATSGEVRLGSAAAAQQAIKGTQRNTAEQTFLTALNAYAVAIQPVADPVGTATTTLTAAIGAFASAVSAALSAKVKLE